MLFILYSNKFADLKRESVTNTQKSLHLLFWNLKKEINLFMFKSIFEIIRWIDLSLGQERHSLGAVYMFLSVEQLTSLYIHSLKFYSVYLVWKFTVSLDVSVYDSTS